MGMTRVRYSEAFKQQVVQGLDEGKFRSLHAACRAYGIGLRLRRRLRITTCPQALPRQLCGRIEARLSVRRNLRLLDNRNRYRDRYRNRKKMR